MGPAALGKGKRTRWPSSRGDTSAATLDPPIKKLAKSKGVPTLAKANGLKSAKPLSDNDAEAMARAEGLVLMQSKSGSGYKFVYERSTSGITSFEVALPKAPNFASRYLFESLGLGLRDYAK